MEEPHKQAPIEPPDLETYRRVFYASPNYITFSRLSDGKYIDVNPVFEQFTGFKRDDVIGRTSMEMDLFPYPEQRAVFVQALLAAGELHAYPAHFYNHNREIRDVEVSASISTINNEQILVAIVRDVTERKRDEDELRQYRDRLEQLVAQRAGELEQANRELRETNRKLEEAHNQLLQTEKMASIGQLAAGVAHEINNPVGFVNSNLGSLDSHIRKLLQVIDAYEQREPVFAACPEQLQAIAAIKADVELDYLKEDVFTLLDESKDGMQRVRKIVQDLKDFSHVGAAEWQLADVHAGIDSTLNIVSNEIKYKAKVIKQYGQLPAIECLPLELNQVFLNMLVNAAQAIPDFGDIVIRTGTQDEQAWIEFQDTGSGISAENMNRIFDPFFTTKPVGQGTGLGLSLSYGIVQKHQGHIDVVSTPGQGTCFRIWLPLRQKHVPDPR